jgi:hypothetical protein
MTLRAGALMPYYQVPPLGTRMERCNRYNQETLEQIRRGRAQIVEQQARLEHSRGFGRTPAGCRRSSRLERVCSLIRN